MCLLYKWKRILWIVNENDFSKYSILLNYIYGTKALFKVKRVYLKEENLLEFNATTFSPDKRHHIFYQKKL